MKTRCSVLLKRALALLLFTCLVDCASEEGLSRGGKASALRSKLGLGGWRTQRGGSCLSYGHSCWGAHGKRSGAPEDKMFLDRSPPPHLSEWYIAKILGRAALHEMQRRKAAEGLLANDINAIYKTRPALENEAKLSGMEIGDWVPDGTENAISDMEFSPSGLRLLKALKPNSRMMTEEN